MKFTKVRVVYFKHKKGRNEGMRIGEEVVCNMDGVVVEAVAMFGGVRKMK
jgi:hypothetical protein